MLCTRRFFLIIHDWFCLLKKQAFCSINTGAQVRRMCLFEQRARANALSALHAAKHITRCCTSRTPDKPADHCRRAALSHWPRLAAKAPAANGRARWPFSVQPNRCVPVCVLVTVGLARLAAWQIQATFALNLHHCCQVTIAHAQQRMRRSVWLQVHMAAPPKEAALTSRSCLI